MRAERRAIVVEGPKVPLPIPRDPLGRVSESHGRVSPLAGFARVALNLQHIGKVLHYVNEEPSEPNAVTLAVDSNPGQAVVPIAAADAWETRRAGRMASTEGAQTL